MLRSVARGDRGLPEDELLVLQYVRTRDYFRNMVITCKYIVEYSCVTRTINFEFTLSLTTSITDDDDDKK